MLHLKNLDKEKQMRPKVSRQKEIIKIRAKNRKFIFNQDGRFSERVQLNER